MCGLGGGPSHYGHASGASGRPKRLAMGVGRLGDYPSSSRWSHSDGTLVH